MRWWQTILISAAVSTAGVALLVVQDTGWAQAGTVGYLLSFWPALAIPWLTGYALVSLVSVTISVAAGGFSNDSTESWPFSYAAQLAAVQYFTSLAALLGFAVAPVEVPAGLHWPAVVDNPAALLSCTASVFLGLLGWIVLAVSQHKRAASTAARPTGGPELPMLREILEILRSEPKGGGSTADFARAMEQIEQGQRSVLPVLEEIATAVNRLRAGLDAVKLQVQTRANADAGDGSDSGDAPAAARLKDAASDIDKAVSRLTQVIDLLAAADAREAANDPSPHLRERLSGELQEMLRDMSVPDLDDAARGR
jgi:hypothetical protein